MLSTMDLKTCTKCEICALQSAAAIELHHIIPQTDPRCTNDPFNLAAICGSCHNEVHKGFKIIEGRYQTSIGLKLFWHEVDKPHTIRPGIYLLKSGMAEIRD